MKWPEVKAGNLLTVQNGFAFQSEYFSETSGIPLIRIRDLPRSSTEINYDGPYREEFLVQPGDYLIGMDGDFACHQWSGPEALLNQRVCRLTKFSKYAHPRFVYYRIQQELSAIQRKTSFVTVKHLSSKQIESIAFPLPPVTEQLKVVEILDQANTLRKKRTEADTNADRILPTLFYKMFGDPLMNSLGWDMHGLGELCSAITSGSRGWARYAGSGNSFFVRTQDVVDGEISSTLLPIDPPSGAEANRTRLQDGDVVITITGVVGKAAVYRDCGRQAYVSQHVALVRTKSLLEPEYLTALANLPAGGASILARLQYGQTKPGLGFRELRGVRIPLPPIEFQRRFASIIKKTRATKQSTQTARDRLEKLRSSLLHRAFSGDLTAKWREAHMKELVVEMEQQTKALSGSC